MPAPAMPRLCGGVSRTTSGFDASSSSKSCSRTHCSSSGICRSTSRTSSAGATWSSASRAMTRPIVSSASLGAASFGKYFGHSSSASVRMRVCSTSFSATRARVQRLGRVAGLDLERELRRVELRAQAERARGDGARREALVERFEPANEVLDRRSRRGEALVERRALGGREVRHLERVARGPGRTRPARRGSGRSRAACARASGSRCWLSRRRSRRTRARAARLNMRSRSSSGAKVRSRSSANGSATL